MRQLLPVPKDDVDPVDVYRDFPAVDGRPSVRLNMISSLDGATSVGGLSGSLGGPADRRVFIAQRSLVDVVLVAAGTMRAEGYGPARLPPPAIEARRGRGQSDVPLIAVVTRACRLDWESAFFTAATVRPVVITAGVAAAEDRARAAEVADVVIAGQDGVALERAIAELGERGARTVLAEGGPTLNSQLAAAGVLDELTLTLSPRLVGTVSKRILGDADLMARLELTLHTLCEEDGFLFLRYRAGGGRTQ